MPQEELEGTCGLAVTQGSMLLTSLPPSTVDSYSIEDPRACGRGGDKAGAGSRLAV